MRGYWDHRLMVRAEHDGGAGGGQGDGSGAGSGNNGGKGNQTPPPWASEFGDNFDAERAWRTIENLRNQEKTLTNERNSAQRKAKEYEDQGKTELEKLQGQVATLTEENQRFKDQAKTAGLTAQVTEYARTAGAHNPSDIYALLDPSTFDVADDGKIKNVKSLVDGLKRDKTYLFNPRSVDAGAGNNGRRAADGGSNGDKAGSGFNEGVRQMFNIGG